MSFRSRILAGTLCVCALAVSFAQSAKCGMLEDTSAFGSPAQLAAAGFGGINGGGINVGVLEAGGGLPLLGATQPYLPNAGANATLSLPAQNAGQTASAVTDHSTEVSGVVVASGTPGGGSANGIAPGATVQAAGFFTNTDAIINGQALTLSSYLNAANNPTAKTRSHIINMSFGNSASPNGLSNLSEWVDWAAIPVSSNVNTSPSPQDNLFVISAGNSGGSMNPSMGQPADSYNGLTIGSTGVRTGGNVAYNQLASYTSTTLTSDTRTLNNGTAAITFGRLKTDMVAPGGDPGPSGAAVTNLMGNPVNNLPNNVNQFLTTSGQQFELANGSAAGNPAAIYSVDDINGTGITNGDYLIADNNNVYGGKNNAPAVLTNAQGNANLVVAGNNVLPSTLAGTSFAAPLVSGAAADIEQFGTNAGFSTDSRVVKALLMNGATITAPGGGPLLDGNGRAWAPALNPMNPAGNKLQFMPGLGAAAGQVFSKADPFNTFANGSEPIKIALDPQLGTGQLNVVNSLKNYAAGQQGPGNVNPTGWDLHTISGYNPASITPNVDADPLTFTENSNPAINDYIFSTGAAQLTATLTWDRIVSINGAVNGAATPTSTFNATNASGASTGSGGSLSDLELFLWEVDPTNTFQLVDYSTDDADNVQHLLTDLPGGTYELQVRDLSPQGDTYALAWAVPEPGTIALLIGCVPALLTLRRRKSHDAVPQAVA